MGFMPTGHADALPGGRRRRRYHLGLAALGLTALGLAGFSGTAAANPPAPADCKTVTASMVRPDSAGAGPYNWATDTFSRTAKICHAVVVAAPAVEVKSWTYTVEVSDSGTFKTLGVKSFKGATMTESVDGTFRGSLAGPDGTLAYKGTFEAPKKWGLWLGKVVDGDKYSTSEWVEHLWSDGFEAGDAKFSWTYRTCNEKLTNASTGNPGDVTGLSKLPCYGKPAVVSNCDGTLTVTLTNGAPSPQSRAVYWVSGLETNKGFVVVAGGKPGAVTVQVKPDTNGMIVMKIGHEVKKYAYKRPVCTSPSVTPVASGGNNTGTPSLPVTGFNAVEMAGFGVGALIAGAVIVLALRRRRVRFEA